MDAAGPTRAEAPPLMDGRSGLMRAALRGLMQPLKSDTVSLQVGLLGAGGWRGRSFYAPPSLVNMTKGHCAFHGFLDGLRSLQKEMLLERRCFPHDILQKLIISHN